MNAESHRNPPFTETSSRRWMRMLLRRLVRLRRAPGIRLLWRYRRCLPLVSFLLGVGSFFLVERQAQLAQWVVAGMLLVWLALLFEGVLARLLAPFLGMRLPPWLLRFGAQMLHQETLFFVLPFFLVTTTWASGQAFFTGLIVVAALVSTIDPLYFDQVAQRRWLFLGFHGFTLFVVLLTAGPILLELTTGQTVALAAVAMAVCALPSFADALRPRRWWRWALLIVLSVGMGTAAWYGRFWIPPATLRTTAVVLSTRMNAATRTPGPARTEFSVAELQAGGLYAFTAIKAPRGLHQGVLHVWTHDGEVVDRIALTIVGGSRTQGYRTWSHKLSFGPHPVGDWRLAVRTDDGQLIGVRHFEVHASGTATADRDAHASAASTRARNAS